MVLPHSRYSAARLSYFNPLPPHGGRQTKTAALLAARHFNPLPPHGGRPPNTKKQQLHGQNFNPLPPHGGRQHAAGCCPVGKDFNPLPPHGGRHAADPHDGSCPEISIHSLRMEGDEPLQTTMTNFKAFQSTPSAWRETAHSAVVGLGIQKFQSTPSAWRETSHVFP